MQKLLMLLWAVPVYAMENDNVWQELKPRTQQQLEAANLKREEALQCLVCSRPKDVTHWKENNCKVCLDRIMRYQKFLELLKEKV